ncbi:MAG: urease accessory protein UreD [Burkholderiales bacterium]|jgi:urease accessory protein|nr:urease accessory protein UreD [Burkholderiales bacterium]MBP7520181.1 urease accessory protein UreD [Leptothrix sp. (in: b-proteobacteria)]HQY07636.1 urease accessory protein UreD [Burkholderiaceae bacterium]
MTWLGHLDLHYTSHQGETRALDRHHGPLRVLRRLYPEGPAVCHHVLVHPPGGIVGGDRLEVEARLDAGSHALLTTPGATRFYRSGGAVAEQRVRARLEDGARLEWLPLETLAYRGCRAENHLRFELAPGAEMMGWDLLALGLPAAGEPWDEGDYLQHLELPGVWLERARVRADDHRLLHSPLGWAGQGVLATLWFATGKLLEPSRREALLEAARAAVDTFEPVLPAGATSPDDRVLVLRALAPRVEPVMALLQQVWARWRQAGWGLAPCPPRVWRT